jgi:hypothetical protein
VSTTTIQHVRTFRAAPGADFSDEDAQHYGQYLEQNVGLGERPVAPREIVDAARPPQSPLHSRFTWDDSEAAERWRETEARHLVAHIVTTVPTDDGTEMTTRAFHSVVAKPDEDSEDPPTRGYMSEHVVWQRPGLSDQLLDENDE